MIIDAHTHFYDPGRPEGVPWPSRDDGLLYRTVLPEHLRAVAGRLEVTGTVAVEASPWLEDNQWVLDLARNEPFIVGFVGNLDPLSPDFERNLTRFSADPVFRGIRLGFPPDADGELDGLLPGIEMLVQRNLALDWMAGPDDLARAGLVASRFPELRLVIDHVAHVPVTGEVPDARWVDGIRALAKFPNVYCKVSALAELARTHPAPCDPGYYLPVLDALWNAFGESRLLYGSNWPVCERAAPYEAVIRIVAGFFGAMGEEVSKRFFHKNAAAAYQLHTGRSVAG